MFRNKTNQDQKDLEQGLLNADYSPILSDVIPLRTYRMDAQDENQYQHYQLALVSTEFNDLQAECDERENEIRESGVRKMSLKTMGYSKKIRTVFNIIGKLKRGTKPDSSENVEVIHDGKYQPKWTALHLASARGLGIKIRELLKSGADPNIIDDRGRTALDVAGIAFYQGIEIYSLADVLQTLMNAGGIFNTMKGNIDVLDTPIHTAIELNCFDSIKLLLDANASVNCLNSSGLTPLHLCIKNKQDKLLKVLLTYNRNDAETIAERANTRDHSGFTLLQAAVVTEWTQGVSVLLDAGADVSATSNLPFDFYNNVIIDDSIHFIYRLEQIHETPVHLAAEVGNQTIMRKLLNKRITASNFPNHLGQSPLYIAIRGGHIGCIKILLNMNANILNISDDGQNALHAAVRFGHEDVVEFLLDYQNVAHKLLNSMDRQGYAPIHSAAAFNRASCIEQFAKNNAFLRLKTKGDFIADWTPLHIAAAKNYPDVAEVLLNFDKTAIDVVDQKGRLPIHLAADRRNREVMAIILRKGSVLSSLTQRDKHWRHNKEKDVTALEMISTELPNPASFFEEVFDSFIDSTDKEFDNDSGGLISMDYGVFSKVNGISQIDVIKELARCGQDKLLIHPLVESLIYLKWKTLIPFFYVTIGIYGFFALILYAVIIGDFYDEHREKKENYSNYLVSPLVIVIILELLYINVHRRMYLTNLENWVKLGTICLACVLLSAGHTSWTEAEWSRHAATLVLLLACAQILFLVSRFPYVGFYVLMFGKVSLNIFKILLTFILLLIAFSLCFMIQYHSKPPFNGPWVASIKTIVMMTSEFEYENLFDHEKHKEELAHSTKLVNVFFLLFLLFVSIVFVNFMVGVAVSDVNDLKTKGNIRRLEKQVEFLSTLEVLAFGAVFKRLLSKLFRAKRFVKGIKIKADVTKTWKVLYEFVLNNENQTFEMEINLPSHILDNIFQKIKSRMEKRDEDREVKLYRKQIHLLYDTIVSKDKDSARDIAENFDNERPSKTRLISNSLNENSTQFKLRLIDKNTQTELKERKPLGPRCYGSRLYFRKRVILLNRAKSTSNLKFKIIEEANNMMELQKTKLKRMQVLLKQL